jgi:hypothetical protein
MNPPKELFTDFDSVAFVLFRQENHELISPVTDGKAGVNCDFLKDIGHMSEDIVSRIVAIGVIDLLEEIDIHHEERHMLARKGVPDNFELKIIQEKAAVMKTGKFILEYEGRGVFADVFQIMEKFLIIHSGILCPSRRTARTMATGI